MKIAALADRLRPALGLLRCPQCAAALRLDGGSLLCESGHCFDLSARGYLNLAPARDQRAEKYDESLFESRRAVFADGFYAPVLDAIRRMLAARFGGAPFALLDAGCGEGYYARGLKAAFPAATVLGADLSRDAVLAAAKGGAEGAPLWFVADLKRLPVRDGALDVVLDVLTPADYAEFGRALAPEGELIKAIPGADYLREVRQAVRDELRNEDFDNARVLKHLQQRATVLERIDVRRTYPLSEAQSAHFLRMTPMTFSVARERLQSVRLTEITVDMVIVRCKIGG